MKNKGTKGLLKHLFFFGVGLALFGLFVYLIGVEGFSQLGQLKLFPLGGALLATLGITASIAGRWGTLANAVGGFRVAAWLDYYHYFIIGRTLGFILPKDVTDLVNRAVWLNKSHGLSISQSGASVIIDRVFDAASAAIFLFGTLPYWLGWVKASVGIGLMLGFTVVVYGILFVNHKPLSIGVAWMMNRGFRLLHRLPWIRKRSFNLLNLTSLDRGIVLRAYIFSMIKFSCTAGRLIFIAIALRVPIPPTLILLGTPAAQLSYLIAFTPGGLGILEAGWFAILKLGGVATEHAMIFVVGQRILTVIFVGILVICSQLLYMLRLHYGRLFTK